MKRIGTKHARYGLLDELRGIAAVIVLVFHIGTRAQAPAVAPNGYLAVDFFFMLSGFVIAEAYRERLLQGMSFREFAVRRLARMMPVVTVGICLGAAYALARWIIAPSRSDSLPDILSATLLNMFLLPKWWPGHASGWEAFPINGPLWSLFFELVINFIWAGLIVFRGRFTLIVLTLAGLLSLSGLTAIHGTLDMGWDIPSFPGGLARVCFGFSVGLLIHAYRRHLPHLGKAAGAIAVGLLILFLAAPISGNGWTLGIAALGLPLILMLAICSPNGSGIPGTRFLGSISYALYGIHVPILALYSGGAEKLFGLNRAGFESYLLVPVIILAAAGVTIYLDRPAQRRLRHLIEKQPFSRRAGQGEFMRQDAGPTILQTPPSDAPLSP